MTERKHVGVERTILCATRFWSIDHIIKGSYERKVATTPTLLSGVKHVVRKQGFSTAAINKAVRKLERLGLVSLPGRKVLRTGKSLGNTIALTAKGGRVGCSTVKLEPWTNDEYLGSQLRGRSRTKKR